MIALYVILTLAGFTGIAYEVASRLIARHERMYHTTHVWKGQALWKRPEWR